MPLKLRAGWEITSDDSGVFLRSDTTGYKITGASDLTTIIQRLKDGTLTPEDFGSRAVQGLLKKLWAGGLLVEIAPNPNQQNADTPLGTYFEHIGLDPAAASRKVESSRVLVLGLGGTGSCVLQHLAGAGVKRFVLVDHDTVAADNLERQFIYQASHIGEPKISAATEYVMSRQPTAEILQIDARIGKATDFAPLLRGGIDLCVICIDDPPDEAFQYSADAMWCASVPSLHGGVMIQSGFYGPLFDVRHSCRPPRSFPIGGQTTSARSRLRLSFPPANSVIASLMSSEAIHFLAGAFRYVDFERRTFIDLKSGSFSKGRTFAPDLSSEEVH